MGTLDPSVLLFLGLVRGSKCARRRWAARAFSYGWAAAGGHRCFPQYRPLGGRPQLSLPAFGANLFPVDFVADCLAGSLPQVSWLHAALLDTEHAPAPLEWGESLVHTVLSGVVHSGLWSRTVIILTYDENGGFFDHVRPAVPPAGTPGEFLNQASLSARARAEATTADHVDLSAEPIGLGFRVPTIVISPFSRNPTPRAGPLVCSDRLDHTSLLRLLETWTTAHGRPARIPDRDPATRTPGLSAWRRGAVGDLTGALDLAAPPDASVPAALLAMVPNRLDPAVLTQCITTGTPGSLTRSTQPIVMDPPVPRTVTLPTQEPSPGPVQRPSGVCATAATRPADAPSGALGPESALPNSGSGIPGVLPVAVAGAALAVVGRRRRGRDGG